MSREVIDGEIYDTEEAECVASYNYRANGIDYESLYITKTGEWFLHNEGSISGIEPYTDIDAMDWLAEKDFVSEYIEHFGEPEE